MLGHLDEVRISEAVHFGNPEVSFERLDQCKTSKQRADPAERWQRGGRGSQGKYVKLPLEKIADFDAEEQEWQVVPAANDPQVVDY